MPKRNSPGELLDGLARPVNACPVPAIAIGGRQAAGVLAAGARGLAIVSAICGTPDPRQAASGLTEAIRKARA